MMSERTCMDCPWFAWRLTSVRDRDMFCAHPAFVESFGGAQYTGTNLVENAPVPVTECPLEEAVKPAEVWAAVMTNLAFWENAPMKATSDRLVKVLRETRSERMDYGK